MDKQDELFNEAHKPLHVPANYDVNDTLQNQLIFALAEIFKGSVREIAAKLAALKNTTQMEVDYVACEKILRDLFDKGLIKGSEQNGEMVYNLSKETHSHKGNVNPRLL
jgi:tRNA U34 2-thiouridine synthase MnmA/TrmU